MNIHEKAYPDHSDIRITGALKPGYEALLSPEALAFLQQLHVQFEPTRQALLHARKARQQQWQAGALPDFPSETLSIRQGAWQISATPPDLLDRRVEITGPVDRKMVINALNSGANCFMACFEDASAPAWSVMMDGQINLRDAVARTISLQDKGKTYTLHDKTGVLIVRPRGWHLDEAHLLIDKQPIAGALMDFGLYLFHNAKTLLANGSGPYFYLPKLEHYLEARLWNDIFIAAQSMLGLPLGTIKATVLIETLPAAFQAEEILFELKEHIVGLNCGRWDYIFSFIKCLGARPDKVLPDRALVTMATPFMNAYALHIIRTCHKRGAHAMGGMSAFIPVKGDEAANASAFDKVRQDKEREVHNGHDGTWVAHPALVAIARAVFDAHMPGQNQRDKIPEGTTTQDMLLTPAAGVKTRAGLALNINVAIHYLAAWLRGQGAVPIHNMMEDAATAEISRCQVWQWYNTNTLLAEGVRVDEALITQIFNDERAAITAQVGAQKYHEGHYESAARLLKQLILARDCADFLTIPAYPLLNAAHDQSLF